MESDKAPYKQVRVEADLLDQQSGVGRVSIELYWAGKQVEKRFVTGDSLIDEEFLLETSALWSCVGCRTKSIGFWRVVRTCFHCRYAISNESRK